METSPKSPEDVPLLVTIPQPRMSKPSVEYHNRRATALSTEFDFFIGRVSSSSSSTTSSIDLIADADTHFILDISPEASDDEETKKLSLRGHSVHKHHHHHHHHKWFRCSYYPQWLAWISSIDHYCSSKIHHLSCGSTDYLFVFGAFVFGSQFMPITLLLSIFFVGIAGFLYLSLCCLVTVIITTFAKAFFGRHRPDCDMLADRRVDFRSRLTNYSFPSGDTAQSAVFAVSLFYLTNSAWYLLLIPNSAWSRIYFGCHWIGDCVIGALVGGIVPIVIWEWIGESGFMNTEHTIAGWIH